MEHRENGGSLATYKVLANQTEPAAQKHPTPEGTGSAAAGTPAAPDEPDRWRPTSDDQWPGTPAASGEPARNRHPMTKLINIYIHVYTYIYTRRASVDSNLAPPS